MTDKEELRQLLTQHPEATLSDGQLRLVEAALDGDKEMVANLLSDEEIANPKFGVGWFAVLLLILIGNSSWLSDEGKKEFMENMKKEIEKLLKEDEQHNL